MRFAWLSDRGLEALYQTGVDMERCMVILTEDRTGWNNQLSNNW